MPDIKNMLKELTGKKNIYFFDCCDDAIFYILRKLKDEGYEKILIPEAGGWFSYKKFPKKLGLDIIYVKTSDSSIDPADLDSKLSALSDFKKIFIMHSYGGYFALQPMATISEVCKRHQCILVNDICGTIGTEYAKYGDYLVCSTGIYKPIAAGFGGFLASDAHEDEQINLQEHDSYFTDLGKELDILYEKLSFYHKMRDKIKADLKGYDILHRSDACINVVIGFNTQEEKENLINYCKNNDLEYVMCPNYIKVNKDAVSIEVKRLKYNKQA